MKKLTYLIVAIWMLTACEDEVDIPLENTAPMLNVDAWLTNTTDTQRIRLSYTRPYFDNDAPTPALDASVIVADAESQKVFEFTDSDEDGTYEWVPATGEQFGTIGHTYGLQVELADGKVYQSFSRMDSVPAIDSITFEYNVKAEPFSEDYYFAEFWARDLPGPGNTYWIKSFKNGEFRGTPEDINTAYDAGFSVGGEVDSLVFIQPIRTAITPFPDDRPAPSPYQKGDTLRVELHAISQDAWFFLFRVADETIRQPGFAQLFANPQANSPTNIVPANREDHVVGFFSVASVAAMEVIMTDDLIRDRLPD